MRCGTNCLAGQQTSSTLSDEPVSGHGGGIRLSLDAAAEHLAGTVSNPGWAQHVIAI